MSFWIKFAVSEALTVAQLLVDHSPLSDVQKKAVDAFIAAGNGLLMVL